jgi:lipoprotein-anchoring transpeptidase ErfK/SrfK
MRHLRVLVGALVLLIVVAAGGVFLATRSDSSSSAAPPKPAAQPVTVPAVNAVLGTAPLRAAMTRGGDLPVYSTPDATTPPMTTLSKQTEYTLPRTVLAFDQYHDWLHVYLPIRPNDATGWVRASDVTLSKPLDWQVEVSLAAHTLTLLHDGVVQFVEPAATGSDDNPTPTGTFYYTDPLDLANQPGTAYGVFAIGLSGHSNTLSEFAGGDGQIAVHGTNDPGTIGQSVSHGCVRVNNDVILKLAKLPLGTPVVIS